MSRKRKAPIRKVYPDPKFHSEVVSKFINSIMYDGKRSTAEKILYDARLLNIRLLVGAIKILHKCDQAREEGGRQWNRFLQKNK